VAPRRHPQARQHRREHSLGRDDPHQPPDHASMLPELGSPSG
jgi:hypothetical protein